MKLLLVKDIIYKIIEEVLISPPEKNSLIIQLR